MDDKNRRFRIIVFFLFLVLPTVVWGLLKPTGLRDKLDFDVDENREKYQFEPTGSVQTLPMGIEAWYNDRVPFRSVLLTANRRLMAAIEVPYDTRIEPKLLELADRSMKKDSDEEAEPSGAAESDESESADAISKDPNYFPVKIKNNILEGRDGWYFYAAELYDYTGTNLPDEEELKEFEDAFTKLQTAAENCGMQFAGACFPMKSRIYPEYMPTMKMSEDFKIKVIGNYLRENTDVNFETVYEDLVERKPLGQEYFAKDSHWTCQGALTGVNAVYRMLGLPEIEDGTFETVETMHTGDLSRMRNEPEEEVEYRPLYKPEITAEPTFDDGENYGFNNRGYSEFWSDAPDERTFVIVGDSYSNNMAEYIKKDFKHTVFVNRRYLDMMDPALIEDADFMVFIFCEGNADDPTWDCIGGVRKLAEILDGLEVPAETEAPETSEEQVQE